MKTIDLDFSGDCFEKYINEIKLRVEGLNG
jgi:hypothetical protein